MSLRDDIKLKSVVEPSATRTKSKIEASNREYKINYLLENLIRDFNDYQKYVGIDEGETADIRLRQVFEHDDYKDIVVEAGKLFDSMLENAGWQDPLTSILISRSNQTFFGWLFKIPQEQNKEIHVRVTKPLTKVAEDAENTAFYGV